nr:phosphoenolpyruvate--protein phosphotransferase [Lachnospiraceae bacterium]
MLTYTGKSVYSAVAIGKISIFKRRDTEVKREHISDIDAEKARVAKAKEYSLAQLQTIYDKALKEVGEANAQIFSIHMMMLDDEDYNDSINNIIETQQVNAEYAIAVTADNFAEMFATMEDAYMQARSADVKDISNRMIANLSADDIEQSVTDDKVIICADDLAPSETVSLDKEKVLAFVTAHGSSNSHTAILARNMNIPAIIGVGDEFLAQIKDGQNAAVDGFTGDLYVEPAEDNLSRMTKKHD